MAYQAADDVADHLNPVQSISRSALMALKSLRKSSPNTQSESEPQSEPHSESVAVGGKSRRRRRSRRSNNKSRKGRKSRKVRKSRRGHRVRHGGRRI